VGIIELSVIAVALAADAFAPTTRSMGAIGG